MKEYIKKGFGFQVGVILANAFMAATAKYLLRIKTEKKDSEKKETE